MYNYKGKSYPKHTTTVIARCNEVVAALEQEFSNNTAPRFLHQYFRRADGKGIADRKVLRGLYDCKSTNKKYPGKEVSGIYVLASQRSDGTGVPFYVGISQTIIRRLRQHLFGKDHNSATLAYLMAKHRYGIREERWPKGTRIEALQSFFSPEHRERLQSEIIQARFAIVEIDCPVEMHIAEAYVACHFKSLYNCFETH